MGVNAIYDKKCPIELRLVYFSRHVTLLINFILKLITEMSICYALVLDISCSTILLKRDILIMKEGINF